MNSIHILYKSTKSAIKLNKLDTITPYTEAVVIVAVGRLYLILLSAVCCKGLSGNRLNDAFYAYKDGILNAISVSRVYDYTLPLATNE